MHAQFVIFSEESHDKLETSSQMLPVCWIDVLPPHSWAIPRDFLCERDHLGPSTSI